MHSPDGRWWWNGDSWVPAWSPDGGLWFDGTGWRWPPAPPAPPLVPRRSSWKRTTLIVLGVLVGVVWWGYGFYAYATHDRIQLLELSEILDPAETACGDLVVTLSRPSADRAEGILAGNSSIRQLVETVRAVGDDVLADDRPARAWLADWEDLAVARATFAARLAADPAASFEVPQTDDGYPITGRMADAAGPECERAVQLAADP